MVEGNRPGPAQVAPGVRLWERECARCDFACGFRGMDRCHVCDGTGRVVVREDGAVFAATRAGRESAGEAADTQPPQREDRPGWIA